MSRYRRIKTHGVRLLLIPQEQIRNDVLADMNSELLAARSGASVKANLLAIRASLCVSGKGTRLAKTYRVAKLDV